MHLLEIQGLQKYFGGLAATRNVDYYINEGEIVALMGANGAGKTTLLHTLFRNIADGENELKFEMI